MIDSSPIFQRDYLWNFRDITVHNLRMLPSKVYRTATLTLFQDQDIFSDLIQRNNIRTVIDLRADREIAESGYTKASLQLFNWVRAPFDPWEQSIEFKNTHHHGTNTEIAYRFFAMECKSSIRHAMKAIINEQGSVAIHCHAGKDRTGVFVTLLHMLSGASVETIYADYLASESDTKGRYLKIILDIVAQAGGIENYLNSCGVSKGNIRDLKLKLVKTA